ncbi:MAG: nucleoside hydrolase [Clostridia bacterium]|nr:nucleoside hydrolase [Clostridia bacterium]
MIKRLPIIVDCDPGIDDAVAFCVLDRFAGTDLKIAISTYGNMPLVRTTNNLLTMLEFLKRPDVYVIKGSKEDPERYKNAAYIHGADGMGGLGKTFTQYDTLPSDFENVLYAKIKELAPVNYLALGPLTNLAATARKYPDVYGYINELYIMGGAIGTGNVTPYAEFNIFTDPQGADEVFSKATCPVYVAPLNITTKVYFDFDELSKLAESGSLDPFIAGILTESLKASREYGEAGAVMHDSTAAIMIFDKSKFDFTVCGIRVDTKDHPGETVMTEGSNVHVALSGDTAGILGIISDSLPRA